MAELESRCPDLQSMLLASAWCALPYSIILSRSHILQESCPNYPPLNPFRKLPPRPKA